MLSYRVLRLCFSAGAQPDPGDPNTTNLGRHTQLTVFHSNGAGPAAGNQKRYGGGSQAASDNLTLNRHFAESTISERIMAGQRSSSREPKDEPKDDMLKELGDIEEKLKNKGNNSC